MLKNVLFVVVTTLMCSSMWAQEYSYSIEKSTGTYSDLTGATVISSAAFDESDWYSVSFPFTFNVYGNAYSSCLASAGTCVFGDPIPGNTVTAFGSDLLADNSSNDATISYVVEGSTPNRILKVQVKNAAFVNDVTGNDRANFQTWFYETSNLIEIHFGPISISSAAVWGAGEVGPYIEITNFSPITATILDGSHDENNLSTDENAFTDAPAEGSIYKFTRNLIEPKYSFAASTGTYTPISGTVISTAGFDDESHFNINLPFTMTVNGIEYTSVHVSTNGLLFDEANFTDIVLINSLDLGDNASNTASISILTEGVSPNRIFKIQFKDLACVNDANNADFVNMQIWLLENGQKIEFHYGNFSVVNQDSYDGESGSLVGILESALVGIYVKGDDSSPISSGIAGNYTLIPAEGKVFTFTPLFPLSTRKAGAGLQFQVFPNPSQGTFQVQLGESIQTASVHVYNTLGNELYTSQLSNTSNTITTSLDKGMYVLKIVDANGASASRMLVVE